jgi:formamidopyrimidine-DNA glycosylase
MPEGPEATIMSDDLRKHFVGRTINKLDVHHEKLQKYHVSKLKVPCEIVDIWTYGKRPIIQTTTGYLVTFLSLHGRWLLPTTDSKYPRLTLILDDIENKHKKITYDDSSMRGFVEYIPDKTALELHFEDKGRDLLSDAPTLKEFTDTLRKRFRKTTSVHDFLLSPKATSSIGNYLMADILYDAKISPYRSLGSLTTDDISKLYDSALKIVELSYKQGGFTLATYLRPDGTYGGYSSLVYGQKTDKLGNKVRNDKIKNRSTYWVPTIQI